MSIIQLVNGYSKGDGVGNVIAAIEYLLNANGYNTRIDNKTLCFEDIDSDDYSEDDILFYHVALTVDPLVCYLKCKKILVFHNITDPELLLGSGLDKMRILCSSGLYDIRALSKYFDAAIVFSQYSKDILLENGWRDVCIFQIPIMLRFDKFSGEYEESIVEKYRDGKTNILFTGRIFPNKRQEELVHAFRNYKDNYNANARLILVGGAGNADYLNSLIQLIDNLNLENDVIISGKVPLKEYIAYYKVADAFLCMSAHEGFCIPLVEAMFFGVPIVAINSTAVPDTLDGCGVLIQERNENTISEAINMIVSDMDYREKIISGQYKRLDDLKPDVLSSKYKELLEKCIGLKSRHLYKILDNRLLVTDRITITPAMENKEVVIYGFGAAGHRLYDKLRHNNIGIIAVCDKNYNDSMYRNFKVLNPVDAFKQFNEANYVISIQDKKASRDVLYMIMENGIKKEKIYIYDEEKNEIF